MCTECGCGGNESLGNGYYEDTPEAIEASNQRSFQRFQQWDKQHYERLAKGEKYNHEWSMQTDQHLHERNMQADRHNHERDMAQQQEQSKWRGRIWKHLTGGD